MASKKQTAAAAAAATLVGPVQPATPPATNVTEASVPKKPATAAQLGKAFALAALREASDVSTFAEAVKAMGAHESFAAYTTFRTEFVKAASDAGYAAAERLWSRTWAAARTVGYLADYPKSPAPEAQAKQAQAAKKKAAVAEVVKGKTPLQLVAESRKASDAGNIAQAADLLQAAKKLQADIDKAAREKAGEATKAVRTRIIDAIGRLVQKGDVKALTQLATLAEKLSPAPKTQPATV